MILPQMPTVDRMVVVQSSPTPVAGQSLPNPANPQTAVESVTCADGYLGPLGLCVTAKVDVGIAVPFLIFALGYVVSVWQKREDRRNSRDGYFKALKTEIDLNVEGLEDAIRDYPSAAEISAFLSLGLDKRPHLLSFYTNDIYKNNLDQLNFLPPGLISGIVYFYQELEFVGRLVASIQHPSFVTISQAGKERVFHDINLGLNLAKEKGEGVKRQLALLVPNG